VAVVWQDLRDHQRELWAKFVAIMDNRAAVYMRQMKVRRGTHLVSRCLRL
jgi:hypothetical protein